jgi:hypothetical protein
MNALALLASLWMVAPATAPAAKELPLRNGDFEAATLEGWDDKGDRGMSVLSKDAAHGGKQGIRVTDDDAERGSSLYSLPTLPVTAGKTYQLSVWGRAVQGKGMAVYIQFLDEGGKPMNHRNANNEIVVGIRGADWKEYTLEGAAPEGAKALRVWLHTASPATGVVADVDDIKVTEKGQ